VRARQPPQAVIPRALRALGLVVLLTATCTADESIATHQVPPQVTKRPPPPSPTAILVGAGDIASCARTEDAATARLVKAILIQRSDAVVFTTGDNAYPGGTAAAFQNCYEPTWGVFKNRTRPVPGNASYRSDSSAQGYFGYFGRLAAPPYGYYSYDLDAWHIVALNSSLSMAAGSPQEHWLRKDLASSSKTCTLAYWHVPRFSSGQHGGDSALAAIWRVLYAHGVEVVVNGHDHDYERFRGQTPDGVFDSSGIRQFVVGTGGAALRRLRVWRASQSVVANDHAHGVLKFTLFEGGYYWDFIPVPGNSFLDSGAGTCH
jgi:hypothetical protein